MAGYEYQPAARTFTAEGRREGMVTSKVQADMQVWHASIRGAHVAGSAHNHPLKVRKRGPTGLGVASLGFQVPVVMPEVTFAAGALNGRCQIAIQKLNSRTGQTSDITPIYPPAAMTIGENAEGFTSSIYSQGTEITKIAMKFTVPSTSGGVPLTGSTQAYTGVAAVVAWWRPEDLPGTCYFSINADESGAVAATPIVTSEVRDVTTLPSSLDDTAVTSFVFATSANLTPGTDYWLVFNVTADAASWFHDGGALPPPYPVTGRSRIYRNLPSPAWEGTPQPPTAYSDRLLFELLTAGNERGHNNFVTLVDQNITVTNLDDIAEPDVLYENFDKLVLCIRTPELDGWAAVAEALATDTTITFNNTLDISDLGTRRRVIPTFNRPLGGLRHVVTHQVGQVKRLVGIGRPGWDNWVDGNLATTAGVTYLRRAGTPGSYESDRYVFASDDMDQGLDGISTLAPYDKLLCTVYDCRGDIVAGMPGPRSVPQGGTEIFRGVIAVEDVDGEDFAFIEQLEGSPESRKDGTVAGNMLRAEFRRQVLVTVTTGSATASLTYASDDTGTGPDNWNGDGSPAYIAHLWMIGTGLRAGELTIGDETIMRVTPNGSVRNVPWPTQIYFPSSELILEDIYRGESGTRQFSLEPEAKNIYFGGGRADNWEGTAAKLTLKKLPVTNAIIGLHVISKQLCALTASDQVIALSFPRGITEPESVSSAVGYDVGQEVSFATLPFKTQCSSWRSFAIDDENNAYFAGNTGIYSADQQFASLVSANAMFERFQQLDRRTIPDTAAAFDPQHAYVPCIRFTGIGKRNEYRTLFARIDRFLDPNETMLPNDVNISWHMLRLRRQVQMLYYPQTGTWTSLDNFGDTDSVTTVLMQNGDRRMLAGANGRLMLYGAPAVFGSNEISDVYSINRIRGEKWVATVPGTAITSQADGDATDSISVSALSESGAEVNIGYGPFFQSGMWVYKIADDGSWQKAEILFPTTNRAGDITLLVLPTFPWTRIEADEYTLLFGAREFSIEFPTFEPKRGFRSVGLEAFRIVIEDNNADDAFEWPMNLEIITPGGKPTNTRLTTVAIGRAGTRELRFDHTFKPIIAATVTIRLRCLAPPDSHLRIRDIRCGIRHEL